MIALSAAIVEILLSQISSTTHMIQPMKLNFFKIINDIAVPSYAYELLIKTAREHHTRLTTKQLTIWKISYNSMFAIQLCPNRIMLGPCYNQCSGF